MRSFILNNYQHAQLYALTVRVVVIVAACFVADGVRAVLRIPRRPRRLN